MVIHSTNKQVKSRLKLKAALEQWLYSKHPLDQLNVKTLTKLSKINRITFYRQFKDLQDFYKWYMVKDFVFKHANSIPFNFEYAFVKVFQSIQEKRPIYQGIFSSNVGPLLTQFIQDEIYAYQMSNFHRLDHDRQLTEMEMTTQGHFYASGITDLIKQYSLNPKLETVSVTQYVTYALRLVKGYVERAIERKRLGEFETFTTVG